MKGSEDHGSEDHGSEDHGSEDHGSGNTILTTLPQNWRPWMTCMGAPMETIEEWHMFSGKGGFNFLFFFPIAECLTALCNFFFSIFFLKLKTV